MMKKDCYHCIRLRLVNSKCTVTRLIVENVHENTCEYWKEDTWMTQQEIQKSLLKEEEKKDA